MSDEKRRYQMKRRAEQEAETRLRITESAVDLHGTLGPARTSVSAVAERAGVRRSTVYRHFPDERALFGACSAHWAASNPPPDLGRWRQVADPDERLELALGELYAYYRRSGSMLDRLLRDEEAVPIVGELMGGFRTLLAEADRRSPAGQAGPRPRPREGAGRDRPRARLHHLARPDRGAGARRRGCRRADVTPGRAAAPEPPRSKPLGFGTGFAWPLSFAVSSSVVVAPLRLLPAATISSLISFFRGRFFRASFRALLKLIV